MGQARQRPRRTGQPRRWCSGTGAGHPLRQDGRRRPGNSHADDAAGHKRRARLPRRHQAPRRPHPVKRLCALQANVSRRPERRNAVRSPRPTSSKLVGALLVALSAVLFTAAGASALWLCSCRELATNPAPSSCPSAAALTRAPPTPLDPYADFPEVDWRFWQGVNPAVVGWVTVPGTSVDLPIVQAPADDPTYYLSHDVYGNWSVYGCPYLDAACARDGFRSKNAVVSGHSLRFDGSMFTPIASFADPVWASVHRQVWLQTPDEKMRLLVRAADVVAGRQAAKVTAFSSDDAFAAWWRSALEGADMALEPAAAVPERAVTLVTCSYLYNPEDERCTVFCSEQEQPR
ncbi:sortase [Eggerthellaceae bacterium zg-893]|nr:sortase [Eggerthellaceae bacterium zg-893]